MRKPYSIDDMGVNWMFGYNTRAKNPILIEASAVYWALWLSKNEVVFDKTLPKSYLQVLFRVTYWLRFWAQLQKHDEDL